jgi:carbonic anhydrase/acetyltransferase-like protein (isoleucine patch superfamily)
MHATLLSRSSVGPESIVGANALVTEGKEFPARSLVVGVPGKLLRDVSDDEVAAVRENARRYAGYGQAHRRGLSAAV